MSSATASTKTCSAVGAEEYSKPRRTSNPASSTAMSGSAIVSDYTKSPGESGTGSRTKKSPASREALRVKPETVAWHHTRNEHPT